MRGQLPAGEGGLRPQITKKEGEGGLCPPRLRRKWYRQLCLRLSQNFSFGKASILKKLALIFILINFSQKIFSIDIAFGISGSLGFAYDVSNNTFEFQSNILMLDWMEQYLRVGLNVSLLKMETNYAYMKYSFLPVEIYYRPLKFSNMFYGTIYGRSEWQFRNSSKVGLDPAGKETKNYFVGTVGGNLSIRPNLWEYADKDMDVWRYYHSHLTLFFEYNTLHQFKIGLSCDILLWLVGLINGIIIIP